MWQLFQTKNVIYSATEHIYMHVEVICDRARLLCGYIKMGYVMKCGVYSRSIYYFYSREDHNFYVHVSTSALPMIWL